jgi:hypothetical protein
LLKIFSQRFDSSNSVGTTLMKSECDMHPEARAEFLESIEYLRAKGGEKTAERFAYEINGQLALIRNYSKPHARS